MTKLTLTPAELQSAIQAEVNAIREVVADGANVVVSLPYWHEVDGNGANWAIATVRNMRGYEGAVVKIIDKYRELYNLPNA